MTATAASGEFHNIFVDPGNRPPTSIPPMPKASDTFIREVADALDMEWLGTDSPAYRAANWIAGKMERYAMMTARPVFEMDGRGPTCSLCETPWPLCGHHHYSESTPPEGDPDEHL